LVRSSVHRIRKPNGGARWPAGHSRLTKAFGLSDADAWRRHANPWSVYTRIPVPLLLTAAI
jgi:hypothetical protein